MGILTDVTGLASSGNKTSVQGVQAGTVLAKRNGYTIKYVVADTTTNPASVLPAAQKLVQQDHVFAVIAVSALTFSAAPFLTSQGVPVVGVAEDGTEWITSNNMFSAYGYTDPRLVTTTYGQYFKMEGGTNLGSLGYSISPSSAEAAKSAAASAQQAGLKTATQQFQSDLKSAGVTTDPTYAEYAGYSSIALLVQGLQGAGSNPSQSSLINALSHITNFNSAGLFGSHSINLSQRIGSSGPDNCYWFAKYSGTTFQPVSGATPLCGTIVPGKTVSPSS